MPELGKEEGMGPREGRKDKANYGETRQQEKENKHVLRKKDLADFEVPFFFFNSMSQIKIFWLSGAP